MASVGIDAQEGVRGRIPSGERFDVVVVGAGNAALTAVLSARAGGVRVAALEKADRALRGGNTRFAGGLFGCTYDGLEDLAPIVGSNDDPSTVMVDPYPDERYLADIAKTTGGLADPVLSRLVVEGPTTPCVGGRSRRALGVQPCRRRRRRARFEPGQAAPRLRAPHAR